MKCAMSELLSISEHEKFKVGSLVEKLSIYVRDRRAKNSRDKQ